MYYVRHQRGSSSVEQEWSGTSIRSGPLGFIFHVNKWIIVPNKRLEVTKSHHLYTPLGIINTPKKCENPVILFSINVTLDQSGAEPISTSIDMSNYKFWSHEKYSCQRMERFSSLSRITIYKNMLHGKMK